MKVAIIGAGVSGLSAGCYLQMNGFETEIFERISGPGGLCTSWVKGGYTFNSSLDWLMGSNESSQFYKLWSELIDMGSIRFYHPEIRQDIETVHHQDKYGSKVFHLYTNLSRLESYLTDLSPEDKGTIRKFIRDIRKIQTFEIPPEIRKVPSLLPWYRKINYARYLPMLFFLKRYGRITSSSFAARLKNPFLKEAFSLLFNGDDRPILIHTIPLAYFDRHGAGYPIGGSLAFARKIEERFLSLGGTIQYNSEVEQVIVEGNMAKGLILKNGREVKADYVLSAADWHFSVFNALGGKFIDRTIQALGNQEMLPVFPSVFLVFLGLKKKVTEYSSLYRFPLEKTLVSPDGTEYPRIELHVHNYDPTLAPGGGSVVSACLYTSKGNYWIDLLESDKEAYHKIKDAFATQIVDILDRKLEGIRGSIDEMNVSTPASIHRYTNNWQGSTQGWLPGEKIISPSPVAQQLPGLRNFYLSGHWTQPGGGLPVAVKSARDAAMMICHQAGIRFRVIFPD